MIFKAGDIVKVKEGAPIGGSPVCVITDSEPLPCPNNCGDKNCVEWLNLKLIDSPHYINHISSCQLDMYTEEPITETKHFMIKCGCGVILTQCPCPVKWSDKGTGKPITVIPRGCNMCHQSTVSLTYIENDTWKLEQANTSCILTKADIEFICTITNRFYD